MTTTSTIKPILFSTEMVQAILGGRKTQTRRIVKLQPKADLNKYSLRKIEDEKHKIYFAMCLKDGIDDLPYHGFFYPKYQIGDILWVLEIFFPFGDDFIHKANSLASDLDVKWKPSLFMPKEACRIFLKVTNMRCERLQDISESDSIAEGVDINYPTVFKDYLAKNHSISGFDTAKESFQTLWDSINLKKAPWKSNPWVWVYDFEITEKPENFLP